jgi:predicted SAM-dependent methyltransferase
VSVCPICLGEEFLDVNRRRNGQCSRCNSLERTRLQWLVLDRLLCDNKVLDVLHFAPDEGIARKLYDRYGAHYRAFDFNPELYPFNFVEVKQLDLCRPKASFPPESCDLVLHSHVLEHLACDYVGVMIALNTALRPGGLHIFSVAIAGNCYQENLDPSMTNQERRERFGQEDHMRTFGRLDLKSQLYELFQQDVHYSKLVQLSNETLRQAAVPLSVIKQMTSHTVFVWRKPYL